MQTQVMKSLKWEYRFKYKDLRIFTRDSVNMVNKYEQTKSISYELMCQSLSAARYDFNTISGMSMIMDPWPTIWVKIAISRWKYMKLICLQRNTENKSVCKMNCYDGIITWEHPCFFSFWKTVYLNLNSHSKMHFYIRLWSRTWLYHCQRTY